MTTYKIRIYTTDEAFIKALLYSDNKEDAVYALMKARGDNMNYDTYEENYSAMDDFIVV